MKKITVSDASELPIRLDIYLTDWSKHSQQLWSRSQITKAIRNGNIHVNDVSVKPGHILNLGDHITVDIDKINYNPQEHIKPKKIDFEIVYEDDAIIIVNKPNGLVVHPAQGHYDDTLLNGLLYHSKQLSDINGESRLGIVHRIDKYTTGLLIIAKTNQAHTNLAEQLKSRTIHRKYVAICRGVLSEDTGTINAPIGRDPKNRLKQAVTSVNSKHAVTNFVVIKREKSYTYIECKLTTGRTHQIRVHFNYIGKPVLGDHHYGVAEDKHSAFGQYLHAKELSFIHPVTNQEIHFTAELPKEFINKISELNLN